MIFTFLMRAMCILYFSVSALFTGLCETNDSHTPDLPLQQFANCHDSFLQLSVKSLSGFQKTLTLFSHTNKKLNLCNCTY